MDSVPQAYRVAYNAHYPVHILDMLVCIQQQCHMHRVLTRGSEHGQCGRLPARRWGLRRVLLGVSLDFRRHPQIAIRVFVDVSRLNADVQ